MFTLMVDGYSTIKSGVIVAPLGPIDVLYILIYIYICIYITCIRCGMVRSSLRYIYIYVPVSMINDLGILNYSPNCSSGLSSVSSCVSVLTLSSSCSVWTQNHCTNEKHKIGRGRGVICSRRLQSQYISFQLIDQEKDNPVTAKAIGVHTTYTRHFDRFLPAITHNFGPWRYSVPVCTHWSIPKIIQHLWK